MPARPMTEEQKRELARSAFMLSNPAVASAYKADPRVALANALMEQGGNTSPVASGSWGIADGLARVGSGIAGGLIGRRERERYGARNAQVEAGIAAGVQEANAANFDPTPAPAANPLNLVTEALYGGGGAAPSPSPVSASGGAPAPAMGVPPANPTPAPAFGGRGAQSARPDAAALYRNAIVPTEGGTDANGRFLTSPKGAVGPGQVMPSTAPEAARLAGVPFNDYLYRNDADYNNRLGEAYYEAKLAEFGGDAIKAAAAYNAGAGRVRRAIRASQRSGQDWTAHLPAETQDYLGKFQARVNEMGPGDGFSFSMSGPVDGIQDMSAYMEDVPPLPEMEALPEAPAFGERVRSQRLAIASAILNGDGDLTDRMTGYREFATPAAFQEDMEAQMQRDENISQRDNIGYQYNLSSAQARNTNVQEANIRAAQDAAEYNRQLILRQLDAQGRIALQEQKGRDSVAAAAARRPNAFDPRDKYYWSKAGQEQRSGYLADAQAARKAMTDSERVAAIAATANTGGWTYAGLAGDARAKYDANVAELNGIRNDIVQGKLGGKLGAGISNADVDFLRQATPLGSGTPPKLVREEAERIRAAALRQHEYNTFALKMFETGSDEEYKKFGPRWNLYNEQVPVFVGRGQVNPNSRIGYQKWLEAAMKAGLVQ